MVERVTTKWCVCMLYTCNNFNYYVNFVYSLTFWFHCHTSQNCYLHASHLVIIQLKTPYLKSVNKHWNRHVINLHNKLVVPLNPMQVEFLQPEKTFVKATREGSSPTCILVVHNCHCCVYDCQFYATDLCFSCILIAIKIDRNIWNMANWLRRNWVRSGSM